MPPVLSASAPDDDDAADLSDNTTAFSAFAAEVAESPLLREYGLAKSRAIIEEIQRNVSNMSDEYDAGLAYGRAIRGRFLTPMVDDPNLPFGDALVCIGGAIFIAQWALSPAIPASVKIPPPSWLTPITLPPGIDWRGIPYILPALVHGSELAFCWILGALAASAYEAGAYEGSLREAISRTWRAGAFAVGMLLLSTQLTTYLSLTSQGLDPYTVPTTAGIDSGSQADLQILSTAFEVIIDVGVQATQLTLWRVFRWRVSQNNEPPPDGDGRGRRPDYKADPYSPFNR